jgi:cytochrome b subunit of formate dehydrogenase
MSRHLSQTGAEQVWYQRFNYYHRFLHVLIMVSFLGLVLSGMPLKYAHAGWARTLAAAMGGFQAAGLIHRACGAITFGYFILHLFWVGYWLLRYNKDPFFKFLFGPRSTFPWRQDLMDVMANFRWFLGAGPRPQLDRFTYWEKFDYMAVFWGVGMIGISGLLLWFPVFFAAFLPGWAFNLATIIHSDEALLAAGFIFTIHFFNTHLRPEKFPLDHVIFSGVMSEHEFREERPREWARAQAEGTLESLKRPAPSRTLMIWSHIVGVAAYLMGLALLVLILYAAINEVIPRTPHG